MLITWIILGVLLTELFYLLQLEYADLDKKVDESILNHSYERRNLSEKGKEDLAIEDVSFYLKFLSSCFALVVLVIYRAFYIYRNSITLQFIQEWMDYFMQVLIIIKNLLIFTLPFLFAALGFLIFLTVNFYIGEQYYKSKKKVK